MNKTDRAKAVGFDIESLLEGECRPYQLAPAKPTHTLILLSSGNLVPRNAFGQALEVKAQTPHEPWDFTSKSFAGAPVIEMMQKSSVPFEPTIKDVGVLALGFRDDAVSFRFPRNIPWKQLPLLSKPYYRIGEEMAANVCPYLAEGEPRLSVSRNLVPLVGSLKELKRVFIQPSEGLQYLAAHRARVMLDIFEAPEVEMHFFWSDKVETFDPVRIRNYYHRIERMNREDYNFSLNGAIFLERACNKVWSQEAIPEKVKPRRPWDKKVPTPAKAASHLSRTITVLQTLYAVWAEQEKRGLTPSMIVEDIASIEQKIKSIGYESDWIKEVLSKSDGEREKLLDDWRYHMTTDIDDDHSGKEKDKEKHLRGEITEELRCICKENTRCLEEMLGEEKKTPAQVALPDIDFTPSGWITIEEMFADFQETIKTRNLTSRYKELEKLLAHLLAKKSVAFSERNRISGNITREDNTTVYDYGIVRHYCPDKRVAQAKWLGSGAYKEFDRYQYFDQSDFEGDLTHLKEAGLITKISFFVKSDWNPKKLEPLSYYSRNDDFNIPWVCTQKGQNLLELLPKECRDPDIMLRNEDVPNETAIPRSDRRLMKMFRELKRKVSDMPSSLTTD